MSTIIGQLTQIVERPPSPAEPTNTAVGFFAGTCAKGSTTKPIPVYSIADAEVKCGPRSGGITLYDALDLFFQEGGQVAYVLRVVGPAAAKGTITLYDAAGTNPADSSLVVTAKSVGAWANTMTVQVTDGDDANSFRLLIRNTADPTVVEDSPALATLDAAITWAERTSQYVDIALGQSADLRPRNAAATALTGGGDDAGSIADAHWLLAFNRATADYGPGQICAPGQTTITRQTQLLQHAKDNNRFALLDLANTPTVATLVTAALAIRALTNKLPRFGMICGPWMTVPGVASGASNRTVPGSAFYAGLIARCESMGASPNEPAAGVNGIGRYAIAPAQTFTDAEFDTLTSAGVNLAIVKNSAPRIYGFRTPVDSVTDSNWLQAQNVRLIMALRARSGVILEGFVLKKIDPKRHIFKKLEGRLIALASEYEDDLAGYTVDTESVNTTQTIANRQINAAFDVEPVGMGESVRLNLSKSPIA